MKIGQYLFNQLNIYLHALPTKSSHLKRIKFVFVMLLFIIHSNNTLANQVDFKKVQLATGNDYFPYADKSFPNNGWSTEIIKAIFTQLHWQNKIDILPWERVRILTKAAKYDGAFPYFYSKQRAKDFLYSLPINVLPFNLITIQNSAIKSIKDITNKTFCLPRGYILGEKISKILKPYKLTFERAKGIDGCLKQLQAGWSDLSFISGDFNNKTIQHYYRITAPYNIIKPSLSHVPLYFIVAKQHPQAEFIISEFNKGLQQIEHSGKKATIDLKYRSWLESISDLNNNNIKEKILEKN